MTPEQKEEIYKLRLQGLGYKAIAREMQLTVDAIKGYCKRHHLNGPAEVIELNSEVIKEKNALCLHCKNSIRQKQYGRRKRFCSDACRYSWWNENQDKRSKKPAAIYHYTCENCGRKFSAYGNKQRKYCSHNCFVKFKFWSEEDEI